MKQITNEEIKKTIEALNKKTDDFFPYLLDPFAEEQPEIFDYLYQPDIYTGEEQNILLYPVVLGWHIIKKVLKRKNVISYDFLYEMGSRNEINYNDIIIDGKLSPDEIREELHRPNNQPVLMDYLMQYVEDHLPGKNNPLRMSVIADVIVDLKTVIDCLVIDEASFLAETCDNDYSEDSFNAIKETVALYYDEFKRTPFFMKLKAAEKKESEFIITTFSEMMYNYFLLQPLNWNGRRTVECCLELFPRKVMSDKKFFMVIEPVLTAFMQFCAEKGYVAEGKIIARRLCGIGEDIMDESENPDNWSMGKSLLKEAESQGYDLTKQGDIDAFLKSYNKDKEKAFLLQGKDKPGRNDLCPCGSGKKYKKCCGADE